MSRYADKVAERRREHAREFAAALNIAMTVTERPKAMRDSPQQERRGILVELGSMPAECAAEYEQAAAHLDKAANIARAMLEQTRRSVQKSEAISASLLAETTAPRLRAAAVRLRRLPTKPRGADENHKPRRWTPPMEGTP